MDRVNTYLSKKLIPEVQEKSKTMKSIIDKFNSIQLNTNTIYSSYEELKKNIEPAYAKTEEIILQGIQLMKKQSFKITSDEEKQLNQKQIDEAKSILISNVEYFSQEALKNKNIIKIRKYIEENTSRLIRKTESVIDSSIVNVKKEYDQIINMDYENYKKIGHNFYPDLNQFYKKYQKIANEIAQLMSEKAHSEGVNTIINVLNKYTESTKQELKNQGLRLLNDYNSLINGIRSSFEKEEKAFLKNEFYLNVLKYQGEGSNYTKKYFENILKGKYPFYYHLYNKHGFISDNKAIEASNNLLKWYDLLETIFISPSAAILKYKCHQDIKKAITLDEGFLLISKLEKCVSLYSNIELKLGEERYVKKKNDKGYAFLPELGNFNWIYYEHIRIYDSILNCIEADKYEQKYIIDRDFEKLILYSSIKKIKENVRYELIHSSFNL